MRIISGIAKGRRLASFKGERIRPTADRVKEAIFNILLCDLGTLEGLKVLDLFAGTGNLGIEALSRGADKAVFVDADAASIAVVVKNISTCGFSGSSEVLKRPAEPGIKLLSGRGDRFDLVFMDPPYEKGNVEKALLGLVDGGLLEDGCEVVVEHSLRERPGDAYGTLLLADRRRYGDTEISFYRFERGQ